MIEHHDAIDHGAFSSPLMLLDPMMVMPGVSRGYCARHIAA